MIGSRRRPARYIRGEIVLEEERRRGFLGKKSADAEEEEYWREAELAKRCWRSQFMEKRRDGDASSERVEERDERSHKLVSGTSREGERKRYGARTGSGEQ